MLTDIPLLRTSYFFLDGVKICLETPLVYSFRRIHKPEWAACRGKVFDDFRSNGYLDSLNGFKEQSLQILVEIVASQHFFKMTIG